MSGEGGDPACWLGEGVDLPAGAPRALTATAAGELLAADLVARLATVDADGFPHVTPVWFAWDGDVFLVSSLARRPHVARLLANPKVGLVVDDEGAERPDGERPNRQVRVVGTAAVEPDPGGAVARLVAERYVVGPGAAALHARRARQDRVAIRITPTGWVQVASS